MANNQSKRDKRDRAVVLALGAISDKQVHPTLLGDTLIDIADKIYKFINKTPDTTQQEKN